MYSRRLLVQLLLALVLGVVFCELPMYVDSSNWKNPHDMFGDAEAINKVDEKSRVSNLQEQLVQCQIKLKTKEDFESKSCPKPQQPDIVFMRRYINHLLLYMKYEGDYHTTYVAKMRLDPKDFDTLRKFASGEHDRIQDIDSILHYLIYEIGPEKREPFLETFVGFLKLNCNSILSIAFVFSVFVFVICMQRTGNYPIGYWLIFFFLLSIPVSVYFNYQRLYYEAIAKRHSRMASHNHTMPRECEPDRMTMWEQVVTTVMDRWRRCDEYHKTVNVDPIWEVTPLTAIGETFSLLLLQPMDHMGTAIGKFYANVMREQAWFHGFLVMLVVTMLIIFVILLLCNYRIGIPFLFYMEPARRLAPEPSLQQQQQQTLPQQVRRPMIEEVPVPPVIVEEPVEEEPPPPVTVRPSPAKTVKAVSPMRRSDDDPDCSIDGPGCSGDGAACKFTKSADETETLDFDAQNERNRLVQKTRGLLKDD